MHQPTDRVIKVIEYIVAKAQPVSLAEISCDTCIAKTTLLPLLQTLCEREYFVKDSSGKYSAAAALFALANSVKQNFSASELVHSVLENLAQKTATDPCWYK